MFKIYDKYMLNERVVYTICIVLFIFFCICIEIKHRYLLKNLPIATNYAMLLPSLPCSNSLDTAVTTLYKEGVSCGLGKIEDDLCDKVKTQTDMWSKHADDVMYGDINNRYRRFDLYMPLEGPTLELVKTLLSYWKETKVSLYNPNARVIEVASLVSLPWCSGQMLHTDTDDKIRHRDVVSYGVFLQDVNAWLSPLVVKPENKQAKWHKVVGKKGDVYAWSSKITHGGGANRTNRSRYLFYITIMYPPVTHVEVGGYSLLQQYGDGIKVGDIIKVIKY